MTIPSSTKRIMPKFTEDSCQALADRLRLLKYESEAAEQSKAKGGRAGGNRKALFYAEIAKQAGVRFQGSEDDQHQAQQMSRWMRAPAKRCRLLGEANYNHLADWFLKHHPDLASHIEVPLMRLARNPLYHAVEPLIRASRRGSVTEAMRDMICGEYRLYRPSMLGAPNHGYIGRLTVSHDKENDSFNSREIYVLPDLRLSWDMPGAVFPINDNMFFSLAVEPKDSSVQLRVFNHFVTSWKTLKSDRMQITAFYGWCADRSGDQFYVTPMYAEAIDPDDENDSFEPSFVLINDFPKHVKEALTKLKFINRVGSQTNTYLYHE